MTEHGQGTETIIGQIVADQLGVAPRSRQGHHRRYRDDAAWRRDLGLPWRRHRRGDRIAGRTEAEGKCAFVAGAILQEAPAKLDMQNGWIVDAATLHQRVELAEIARIVYFRSDTLPPGTQAQLSVAHHYAPQGYPFAFTNGVQGCHLELDAETGFVKVLKQWVVEDCGRIINPLLVDEQVRGGVVQGLGAAFFEECVYGENGQLTNGSLADYLVPMAVEMPDIEIGHVETPTLDTQLGAKGVGEAGTAAASAAALNAVNDAMAPFGGSIAQLPMTPARLLRAMNRI